MLYREKTPWLSPKRLTLLGCALLVALAAVWGSVQVSATIRRDISAQTLASIKNAVLRCAVQCYAVEGSYPATLGYLEENYGLQLNHQQYIVDYEVFASNVLPDVAVLQR